MSPMKHFSDSMRFLIFIPLIGVFFLKKSTQEPSGKLQISGVTPVKTGDREEQENEEEENAYTQERLLHEFKMLRNPTTGTIPKNIYDIERQVARSIPSKNRIFDNLSSRVMSIENVSNQNAYVSVGPENVAGRSRTLAFDRRNNAIMLTGGVTGGIFRSIDGGLTWSFVSPENDIRSVTDIVQDPATPNTWYCGTGEVYNVLSSQNTSIYGDFPGGPYGHGIFKSTDNGVSWTKLTSTADADPNAFNGSFDLVHRLAVHPSNGHVYAAVHRSIMRSRNGGQTWETVLSGSTPATGIGGLTEVLMKPDGSKIYAAFSGENPDRALAGVWESSTGDASSWRRIAGGAGGQADSIPGWLAYRKWGRIVLDLSRGNKLYAFYKNDKDASGSNPLPEADLFQCDVSTGNPAAYTWRNLSEFVPNESLGNIANLNPYSTYFNGFAMSIRAKPDNENILFIGGTLLTRVDLTQTDPARKFRRVGGYGRGFIRSSNVYPNHHPDVQNIYFPATNVMYTASDGGIHRTTTDVMADTVRWEGLNRGLQTVQYHFINIIPDIDDSWIIGGTQDNGTLYNINPGTSRNHFDIPTGDGASSAFTGFAKTGNTWRQYWYYSGVQGLIERLSLTWQYNPTNNTLDLPTPPTESSITPVGLANNGQYLTLFINDPDSTEHLYYNNHNRLFRTTSASTVDSSRWTEFTSVASAVTSNADISALAVSKKINGNKYLFLGTEDGKVFRLNNPNTAPGATAPANITPSTMTAGSYVSGISVNPRNPDTVLVVVSSYDNGTTNVVRNVFWSGNATAATPAWQVVDAALNPVSSQSCAIVVKTTGVEYYVGTTIGLYSATAINGNNTAWVNEGSGMLKTAIVRSLVNRQIDNTLVVGTHGNGAFMARIGNAVTIRGDNVATGINDVIRNDNKFIKIVFPTITSGDIYFRTGQILGITEINCKILSSNGQLIYERNMAYSDGVLRTGHLPAGIYTLSITSSNRKYQHIIRFSKN